MGKLDCLYKIEGQGMAKYGDEDPFCRARTPATSLAEGARADVRGFVALPEGLLRSRSTFAARTLTSALELAGAGLGKRRDLGLYAAIVALWAGLALAGCASGHRPPQFVGGADLVYPATAIALAWKAGVVIRYDVTVEGRVANAVVERAEPPACSRRQR